MRIGIVCNCFQDDSAFRGIGRYVLGLIKGMLDRSPEKTHFEFLVDEERPLRGYVETLLSDSRAPERYRIQKIFLDFGYHPSFIRHIRLTRAIDKLDLDLLHIPAQSYICHWMKLPVPYVVTIHDLIPYLARRRQNFEQKCRHRRRIKRLRKNCLNARAVIAISEHTKYDCEKFLGIPGERITVIPLGVDSMFSPMGAPGEAEVLIDRYGVRRPYFLYVGALDYHKNVVGLLEAFRRFRQRNNCLANLVLAGKIPDHARGVSIPPEALEQVCLTGFVEDRDLPALYRNALAMLTLSTYEGFCLPVIEAMACGTPVIASSTTVFPETVGDAGILVDPMNPDEAACAMERVARDPQLAEELRRRGLERAARYTWERAAEATIALYEKALKR